MRPIWAVFYACVFVSAPWSASANGARPKMRLVDLAYLQAGISNQDLEDHSKGLVEDEGVSHGSGLVFDRGVMRRAAEGARWLGGSSDFNSLRWTREEMDRARTHHAAETVYQYAQKILEEQNENELLAVSKDFLQGGEGVLDVADLDHQYAIYAPRRLKGVVAAKSAVTNLMRFSKDLFDILRAPTRAAEKFLEALVATVAIHETVHHRDTRDMGPEELKALTPQDKDQLEIKAFRAQKRVLAKILNGEDPVDKMERLLGGNGDRSWLEKAGEFLGNMRLIDRLSPEELVRRFYAHHHHS